MTESTIDLRQKLLHKLRGGNKRFAHLNATIGRSRDKLDLLSLTKIDSALPKDFIKQLLSDPNLSFKISFKDINSQLMEFINKHSEESESNEGENKDANQEALAALKALRDTKKKLEFLEAFQKEEFSEFGTKSFAFGYPLLVKQMSAKREDVICAPLFIWYLDITRDYRSDSVTISRSEDNPILFNEMLDYYLETELKLDFSEDVQLINSEVLNDGLLDEQELDDSLRKLVGKVSSKVDTKVAGRELEATPKDRPAAAKQLQDADKTELLINAGAFGIFRSGKQSIINDLKTLIEQDDQASIENLELDTAPEHIFSTIETDPSQHQVIGNLKRTQNLIIQGPPGTGKSQTLTALITNALANGRKTLVVCEKRTAMDIIAKNLEKCGLGDYLVLIENINRGRTAVIDKARRIRESNYIPPHRKDEELAQAVSNYEDAASAIGSHHQAIASLSSKGLGDSKALLGKYWRYRSVVTEGDSLASCRAAFANIPFAFDDLEFKAIAEDLQRVNAEYIKSRSLLAMIPRPKIIKHQAYQSDKDALVGYFTHALNELNGLEVDFGKYRNKFVEALLALVGQRHETAKKTASEALQFLTIERDNFNWAGIDASLQKTGQDIKTQSKAQIPYDKIAVLQGNVAFFQENRQKAAEQIAELIDEHKKHLDAAKSYLKDLRDYGIIGLGILKGGALTSLFSNKQKEIKRIKTAFLAEVAQTNKLRSELPELLGEELVVDEQIDTSIDDKISATPSSQNVSTYLDSIEAVKFAEPGTIEPTKANILSAEYINYITDQQFKLYKDLKAFLWVTYKSQIDETLSHVHYLKTVLNFEEVKEKFDASSLELLGSISVHLLDPLSVKEAADKLVADSSTQKIPALELLKQKSLRLLSEGEYSEAFGALITQGMSLDRYQNLEDWLVSAKVAAQDTLQEIEETLYSYHKWCSVYAPLDINTRHIIDCFSSSDIGVQLWQPYFNALYFERLVKDANTSSLLNNDLVLDKLLSSDQKIKSLLLFSIGAKWGVERGLTISNFERGVLRFNSLYNKRGAPGQRRNSLRKIIDRDMKLFTSLFPVVICNPSVTASLFKLEKDLFDIVLFDEASQLRLEDTYTSLYRGKVKIVSGDEHQMPPSNYFQSTALEDNQDYDEDEDIQNQEILNSESLLDYAGINGYLRTMLKVHYRSDHQDLIEFSNRAFYGGQLMPIPKLEDYCPIEFHRVDGVYEDRGNKDEALAIIEWLSKLDQSAIPSVGVVTLNLYQADLIKEMISDKRTSEAEFDGLMVRLEERGFFVKNLENVQGDEREIMLLSTTFGLRQDGKFIQNYGPLNGKQGYRLLNVLVTRAIHKFVVFTSIPDKYIDAYADEINTFGKDGKGIFYAYLAYARAVSKGDATSRQAVLDVLKSEDSDDARGMNMLDDLTESPFEEEVLAALEGIVDGSRIKLQYKVGSEKFRIDMVVLGPDGRRPMLAVECDGYAYHSSPDAYLYDIYRQKMLEGKGFKFYRIWSTNWFHDPETEVRKLGEKIKQLDDQYARWLEAS